MMGAALPIRDELTPQALRRHARFVRRGDSFEIIDSGSLNGTYVNGDRVDSAQLDNGDEVQIGKFRFTFYRSLRSQSDQ